MGEYLGYHPVSMSKKKMEGNPEDEWLSLDQEQKKESLDKLLEVVRSNYLAMLEKHKIHPNNLDEFYNALENNMVDDRLFVKVVGDLKRLSPDLLQVRKRLRQLDSFVNEMTIIFKKHNNKNPSD